MSQRPYFMPSTRPEKPDRLSRSPEVRSCSHNPYFLYTKSFLFALALILSLCAVSNAAQSEARLLRFPAVGGGKIVFCYAGNLYSVDINGGNATKLTSDAGSGCFTRISPGGKSIAFTAQYDGNTEVYSIPIGGGEPKRLTYSALVERNKVGERMGPNNIEMGL